MKNEIWNANIILFFALVRIQVGNPANCAAAGFEETYEKVVDYTYDRSTKVQVDLSKDIGIAVNCLAECSRQGGACLAITLQNERGGRQRCFAHDASAATDETDPTAQTGVTYFEKVCVRRICRKVYTFTRVPQYEYIGEANEEVTDVRSIDECRDARRTQGGTDPVAKTLIGRGFAEGPVIESLDAGVD